MSLAAIGSETELSRWVGLLAPSRQLAEVLADTDFVPRAMRGKPDQVCAAIMYGDELGLGPMQALAGIDVVEGKPRPSAELCRALILRAGHTITVHDMTGQRCRVSGLRAGRPESERVVIEWTHDMARAAGLTSKSNWRSYPRAMLAARATSDLARLLFPDVVKGLGYIAETAESAEVLDQWGSDAAPPVAPELPSRKPPQRKTPARRALRDPGHTIATEDKPGPDGSVDVPLPDDPWTPPQSDENGPPPADLPPEVPEPNSEPEAPPAPISAAKLKALHALLSAVMGSASPPEERRAVLAAIVGHPVESSKLLTRPEGDRALDVLRQLETGALELRGDDDGGFTVEVPGWADADPNTGELP